MDDTPAAKDVVINNPHEDNPNRTLITWKIPKEQWDYMIDNYQFKDSLYSNLFCCVYNGTEVPYRLRLQPHGWTEAQRDGDMYGMCLELAYFPNLVSEIQLNFEMKLLEAPSNHAFVWERAIFTEITGKGPVDGFGIRAVVSQIQTEELTFIADVEITSLATLSAMPEDARNLLEDWQLGGFSEALERDQAIDKDIWGEFDDDYLQTLGMNYPERIKFKRRAKELMAMRGDLQMEEMLQKLREKDKEIERLKREMERRLGDEKESVLEFHRRESYHERLFSEWFHSSFPVKPGNAWDEYLRKMIDVGVNDISFWMKLLEYRGENKRLDGERVLTNVLGIRNPLHIKKIMKMFLKYDARGHSFRDWFVDTLHLEECWEKFAEEGLDELSEVLSQEISDEMLTNMRISKEGHKLRILLELELERGNRPDEDVCG